MSEFVTEDAPWLGEDPVPVLVEDSTSSVPFMAGMMVHSLVRGGVRLPTAYTVARQVERRLTGRDRVQKKELTELLRELLGNEASAGEDLQTPDILVKGPGEGLPFSKGILSQSLLATAIEPVDAFAVAREIEYELRAAGVHEIDRSDLWALACRVLRKREGDEVAERYLLWCKYQETDRPVILLLGGTSGVGKTSLVLEVARRLGIGRTLSTDSIREMMRIMLSPDLVPAIYGSSYDAHKLLPHQGGKRPTVIEGLRAQASAVSVGIRASLDRTLLESANLVIDGVSIVPGLIDLDAYADRADVIFLLIAAIDEEALRNRLAFRATGQSRRLADRYLENLEAILEIQKYLIEIARHHQIPIIDNQSFDATVCSIIDHVMERLRISGSMGASASR